jgi:hypothetical protein
MRRDIARATEVMATHINACVEHTLAGGRLQG